MDVWDSSAILPLVVAQSRSAECKATFRARSARAMACVARVECHSGLQRLARSGGLEAPHRRVALRRLDEVLDGFEVVPFSAVIEARAVELLARHALRALDSLQLATVLELRGSRPHRPIGFVCCDRRLAAAADAEGIDVVLG